MVDGNVPIEMVKEITRVIVTSENARQLQEYMTILDKPADFRGTDKIIIYTVFAS
jgi:hypothetical protein